MRHVAHVPGSELMEPGHDVLPLHADILNRRDSVPCRKHRGPTDVRFR